MSDARRPKFIAALLDALYPPDVACALCGREALLGKDHLCGICRNSLTSAPKIACPAPFAGFTAAFLYDGGAKEGIHALKYKNQVRLASFFADAIVIPPRWEIDCVVPVPLHPLKKWLRSYNQSELIARSLCERLGLPLCPELLQRTRFTRSQTTLNEFERAKNVAKAFCASPAAAGKHILLIDDVTTTHSTLLSCVVALRSAGADRIYAACATVATRERGAALPDSKDIEYAK